MIIERDLSSPSGSPRVSSRLVIAYYGKYSVDEASKVITYRAERSTYPAFGSGSRNASVTVSEDCMMQNSTPIVTPRGTIISQVVFERAK